MKVLIVSTNDVGGAANSCFRLHKGLLDENIDSRVLVSKKLKDYSNTYLHKNNFFKTFALKALGFLKYRIKLRNRHESLELFSFPDAPFDITKSEFYKEASIVNLHWVARFIDYGFFKKNKKPIVWTLHDMNPFTGGEHYDEEYLGIDESGNPIKRQLTSTERRRFEKIKAYKQKCVSRAKDLTIVAPSEWLANEARNSLVFKGRTVYCIPYGLDAAVFSPKDKEQSRSMLNIPNDKKVLLFVADSITNSRKGFVFLKKALEEINDPNVILCAIGKTQMEFSQPANIIQLGTIKDEVLLSHIYSAADVFIIPSLMDNLPNTVLESLFCGTPVIGFPAGGISEMIQDGINGYLTQNISVNSLKLTIEKFLSDHQHFDRDAIRRNAVKKYDQPIQARKYIELFEKILKKNDA